MELRSVYPEISTLPFNLTKFSSSRTSEGRDRDQRQSGLKFIANEKLF
jgi:hypothetical protein